MQMVTKSTNCSSKIVPLMSASKSAVLRRWRHQIAAARYQSGMGKL